MRGWIRNCPWAAVTLVAWTAAISIAHGQEQPAADSSAGFDWSKTPTVHSFPRSGYFGMSPKGPGYYSFWDYLCGEYRPDPPKYGYRPTALQSMSLFEADFRYLDNPKTPPQDFLEALHRVHLGDDWLFATGGETRWRHNHEVSSRASGKINDYDLYRTRVYGDLSYQDKVRLFVEFFDGQSFNQDLPPSRTDIDRSDFYNAFVDVKIWDDGVGKGYLRGGRQEFSFGSQRLLSAPDWGNTRRTFNGVRGYYASETWDVDLFWAQPVIPNPSRVDSVDNNQNFAGFWATCRPDKNHLRDFYYLFLDNTNQTTQLEIVRAPFNIHTFGTRWTGDKNRWLYDVEAMVQFGRQGEHDILAGSVASGFGRHFADLPMGPVVWLYYDYASGDQNPNQGERHTFNQLFPFGHYYFGAIDLVARQNIHDLNAHLILYPTKWITLTTQYHCFRLDSARDALYNSAGTAIRRDPTGAAGRQVGSEVDLFANLHLSKRTDVLIGYSHLWAGNFLERTGAGQDPELFYLMLNYRW